MFREKILPSIICFFIKLFSFTQKLEYQNTDILSDIKSKKQNNIFAFWHGKQFVLINSHKNRGICIMTSLSKDGELQANILKKFGYQIVRGSSSKGGDRALVELIRIVKKGTDIAIAVDGPRGPICHFKPGVLILAQKTGNPIIPVAVSAKSFWQLNTWDKCVIPKPFTKTAVRYGNPIYIKPDDKIDDMLELLDLSLNKLTKELNDELRTKK